MKLNKKINRKINLSISKNKDFPDIITDNSSFRKKKSYSKTERVFSSKINKRKVETEGSSGLTSLIQKTNTSLGINNTYINFNSPIRIPTEGNKN